MRLRVRLLLRNIGASLALTLVLSVVFFVSIERIRGTVFRNSAALGDSATDISAYMLEVLHTEKIHRTAIDTVLLLDERLSRIESHTRMVADIAGSIYTHSHGWGPRPLPLVTVGEIPPPEPYLYIVPGVDFRDIRAEVELVANVTEMLRQITVVDWGIATSTINGESGFVIAMDAFPWIRTDHDPRTFHWYLRARDTGRLYWTDVYGDQRSKGPVISCAVPFFDRSSGRDVFMGVARSTVRLSDFSQIIDPTGIRRSGQFFILNRYGTIVYSTDGLEMTLGEGGMVVGENFLQTTDPRLRSLGQSMTLGATGMTELVWDGIPFYVAYAPIRTLGWSLGVTVPAQEIYVPVMQIESRIREITAATRASIDRYIMLLAGVIALLLFLILPAIAYIAARFTQAITDPILALSDGVHEVAHGNLDREVVVKTGDELEQLAASFNMMTLQLRSHIEETARATAERQRMDTELDIATRIQMSMLPNNFPPFRDGENEFELYAEVHPAREVGGDFYDFFFIDDNHFAVIIADVSGKGIPAALFMATTKAVIKNQLQSIGKPELALELINRELCDNNITSMFVTVWLGILEISSCRLTYINAGHNPPMLGRGGNGFEMLVSPPDLVLAGMEDTRYHCRQTQMRKGDMLFLYTDGITEAAGADGTFYGTARMKAFLNANARQPLREMLAGFRADMETFAAGAEQSDDITMLALRICGPADRPGDSRTPADEKALRDGVRFRLNLKASVSDLDTLAGFIERKLKAAGCPFRERSHVELAAEEIFVNIARYAYRDGENENAKVVVDGRIRATPGGMAITLAFSDFGSPFNPLEHEDPDVTLPIEEREPGGLGILIVKKIIDTIHYSCENGVNRLEFAKSWREEET
ncbi:MAG: SpoIIE family protein phosphatase [Treponema sp.]|nr:SpoIIE family protein phosphatase [Treponema sp.]